MNKLEFTFLNNENKKKWDDYIANSDKATYVHHSSWKDIISEVYGHKPYYIIAQKNENIVGAIPLFLIAIPFVGKILASGVYGSYGGICADNDEITNSLLKKTQELAKTLNVKYLEIKNLNNFNINTKQWEKYYNYYTMILNLDKNPEIVWNNISKKARQNIRKALNSNITIVQGNQYFDEFYKLIADNMRLLGTPVHSKKFYELIVKKFNNAANIYIAKLNGRTASVALTITLGKSIFGYANAAHSDFLSLKPNFLIYWEIIKSARDSSFQYFDLGRSLLNSGTYNFKQNFGAVPVPLYYDYYLNKINNIPAINQDNQKLKFVTKTWSHLPLSVTKLLGPHLIKYVA